MVVILILNAMVINGCFYHAHQDSECYLNTISPKELHPFKGMAMKRVNEQTPAIEKTVEGMGFNVEVVWECEIMTVLKNCENFKDFVQNRCDPPLLNNANRLNQRDCFYGGRCGNVDDLAEVEPGEEISYVDVISLYPSLQVQIHFPKVIQWL